jgi:glycosyltransferase involved in cell wall biosynthesis
VLVYTSTPFRGLDVLLLAFRTIRRAIPDVRLRVFSSMAIYQVAAGQDHYTPLYTQCAADGLDYCGPVGQDKLAEELRGVAGLAYPSTFAETSCIAVLEAMAAGAFIFTTRLGALPETTNGFAHMVDVEADPRVLAERFAAMVIRTWSELAADQAAACRRREAQARHVRDHYRWPARAPNGRPGWRKSRTECRPEPVEISRVGLPCAGGTDWPPGAIAGATGAADDPCHR